MLSSILAHLPASEGAPQGVGTFPLSQLLPRGVGPIPITPPLFSFVPLDYVEILLALSEVRSSVPFSRYSVIIYPHVDIFSMYL